MSRRVKRKVNANATAFQGEQQQQQQQQQQHPQQQPQQQQLQQHQHHQQQLKPKQKQSHQQHQHQHQHQHRHQNQNKNKQQSQGPSQSQSRTYNHNQNQVQVRGQCQSQSQRQVKDQDVEYAFQKMFVNRPWQRGHMRGNGQPSGRPETPYVKSQNTPKPSRSSFKRSSNPIVSKSSQFASSRAQQDSSRLLNKTASSYDGWMLQKSKTSTCKIRPEPVKSAVSPLARNRFYELRDKTPVRDTTKQVPKESKTSKHRMELGWSSIQRGDMQLTKPSTPGNAGQISKARKLPHHVDTYLNIDGSRSWNSFQLTNWRAHHEPKPYNNAETVRFPEPSPPCRLENQPRHKPEDVHTRHRRPAFAFSENEKIAPLLNLATPVRDIWVTRPEHAEFGQLKCVKILPAHHQCAGPERNITPNDVDAKSLALKLEKHCRLQEPGAKPAQCICFRKARRAYCTVCKATITGRAFRKCYAHPDVGFSTDHFYCPFCCAEPLALKDI